MTLVTSTGKCYSSLTSFTNSNVFPDREKTFNSWALPVLFLLGLAQIVLSSTALFIYTISYAPLAIRKKWKAIGVRDTVWQVSKVSLKLNLFFQVSYNDTTKSSLFIGAGWKNTAWSLYFLLTDSLFVYRYVQFLVSLQKYWSGSAEWSTSCLPYLVYGICPTDHISSRSICSTLSCAMSCWKESSNPSLWTANLSSWL